jgi:hypothetical protein
MGQGGLTMILVDRYDHRVYYCEKKTMLKGNRLIYEGKILKFPYFNLNVCEVI